MADNGGSGALHSTSVRDWRDRQVAWDTAEAARRHAELLETIDGRLARLEQSLNDNPADALAALPARRG